MRAKRAAWFGVLGALGLVGVCCLFMLYVGVGYRAVSDVERVDYAHLVVATAAETLHVLPGPFMLEVEGRRGLAPVELSHESPDQSAVDYQVQGLDGWLTYRGTSPQYIRLGDEVAWEAQIYTGASSVQVTTGAWSPSSLYLECSKASSIGLDLKSLSSTPESLNITVLAPKAVIEVRCRADQRVVIWDEVGDAKVVGAVTVFRGQPGLAAGDPWDGAAVMIELSGGSTAKFVVRVERE